MVLLHELSKLTSLRGLETHVPWVDSSLRYVETILHVQNHSLPSFDCLVANIKHFVEVLVLALVTINFENVFHAVQECVESSLVLQHKQVEQISYGAPLVR